MIVNTPALVARVPERLERLKDPPLSLWSIGNLDALKLDGPVVAIVGARACSAYGRSVARHWANELAAIGWTIVSGLARGVDTHAHTGAVEADGVTIAVMGCGVDHIYPVANSELWHQIQEKGCVVSEYGPGVPPATWRFPARNRIIAGLADAVLVVEAREQSGALITADFALQSGVQVFAIPGEITSILSNGTNELLRSGAAKIAVSPRDLREWYEEEQS